MIRRGLFLFASLYIVLIAAGCGGGAGTGSNPVVPSFTLALSATSASVQAGSSTKITVAVQGNNGFNNSVNITVSGLPAGLSATPGSFTLGTGSEKSVTLAVATGNAAGTDAITFSGTSGSESVTASLSLLITAPPPIVTDEHAPIATRFLRSDEPYLNDDPFPPVLAVYSSAHDQFFVANTFLNSVDVYDATGETLTASIPVPQPWGMDISPLDGSVWVGTLLGDIFQINSTNLAVQQHYKAADIGPTGFAASSVAIMKNGNIGLLGPQQGILGVDGVRSVAMWNPTTNTLNGIPRSCGIENYGEFIPVYDHTALATASIDSDGTICTWQATGGAVQSVELNSFVNLLTATPGNGLIVGGTTVLNSNLQTIATLSPAVGVTGGGVSPDGSTAYFVTTIDSDVYAFDLSMNTLKGQAPYCNFGPFQSPYLFAVSNNGLFAGPVGLGAALVDISTLYSSIPNRASLGLPTPNTGPTSGGTQLSEISDAQNADVSNSWAGNAAANSQIGSDGYVSMTTPPAQITGPVDLTVEYSDHELTVDPEGFSYGPTILENTTNAATAEGGQTGVLVGYGFGTAASQIQVSVGGQPAPVTAIGGPPIVGWPLPTQTLSFIIPPGTPGHSVDVVVVTPSGSTTLSGGLTYLPATTQYQNAATLNEGLYDAATQLYYFTASQELEVFNPTSKEWQSPIILPGVTSSSQFTAIAISPNGQIIAVSDSGNSSVYVFEANDPSAYSRTSTSGIAQPTGLTVTDTGRVVFDGEGNDTHGLFWFDATVGQLHSLGYTGEVPSGVGQVVLMPDQSIAWTQVGGYTFGITISSPSVIQCTYCPFQQGGTSHDFTISADGSTMFTLGEWTDANANPEMNIAYKDQEVWLATGVSGEKLNQDGSVMYQPLTDGIDLLSQGTGHLLWRVLTSAAVAQGGFDEEFTTPTAGVIGLITSTGIAFIDTSALSLPSTVKSPPAKLSMSGGRRGMETRGHVILTHAGSL